VPHAPLAAPGGRPPYAMQRRHHRTKLPACRAEPQTADAQAPGPPEATSRPSLAHARPASLGFAAATAIRLRRELGRGRESRWWLGCWGPVGSMPVEQGAVWAAATGPGGESVVGHLNPIHNMAVLWCYFSSFFIHIHVYIIYYVYNFFQSFLVFI